MSNASNMVTYERLRSLLSYDPDTGVFTWVKDHFSAKEGDSAGSWGNGRCYVGIDGDKYLAHRLAVLYMTGVMPPDDMDVDHIDTDRLNNRWKNLRCVTHAINMQNQREKFSYREKEPTSKLRGVSWKSDKSKWRAVISMNGRQKHIGYFDDEQVAYAAYVDAKRLLHEGNTL